MRANTAPLHRRVILCNLIVAKIAVEREERKGKTRKKKEELTKLHVPSDISRKRKISR